MNNLLTHLAALVDHWAIGPYLSSNKAEIKAVANQAELFHGDLIKFRASVAAQGYKSAVDEFKGYSAKAFSTRSFLLNTNEIRNTLIRLINLNDLFHLSLPMHPDWLHENMLDIHGGVRPSYIPRCNCH